MGGKGVRGSNRRGSMSILTVGIHRETPLNINLNINNERQDCKIGTICISGDTSERGEDG
jgi:hypothetical protein